MPMSKKKMIDLLAGAITRAVIKLKEQYPLVDHALVASYILGRLTTDGQLEFFWKDLDKLYHKTHERFAENIAEWE